MKIKTGIKIKHNDKFYVICQILDNENVSAHPILKGKIKFNTVIFIGNDFEIQSNKKEKIKQKAKKKIHKYEPTFFLNFKFAKTNSF